MTQNNIPKHWEIKKLEELLDFVIGGDWGKDENFEDDNYSLAYCIRGSEIKNWNEDKGRTASLRKIKNQNIAKRSLIEGDILVEISGGGPEQPVGRTVLIDKQVLRFKSNIPKICTNFLRLMRPVNSIDPAFLNQYLTYFYKSGEIINYQGGSNNLRNLKFPDYQKINIPIPPLPEQQAIVEKIEELFSEMDNSIASLKTAQQQIKTYRQSVLKSAFEGKLTSKEENLMMVAEPGLEYGEKRLPEGWNWMKFKDLGDWKGGGTPSKRVKEYWEGGKILWVSSKDMKFRIINDSIDKITEVAIPNSSAKLIQKGALLFVMRSGILRHTFPVAIAGRDLTVNQDLQSLTPKDFIKSEFIYWYVVNKNQDIRDKCSKDGTTVESIDTVSLKEYLVPIPDFQEQQQIVSEIESRFSMADKLEESITQSLLQAETLRQSILKKAFEGKLC